MRHENLTLKLPEKMLVQAQSLAVREDISVGQLVRGLLRREIDRKLNPKTSNRADEGLVAALQALLATQMALAEGWSDLAFRLAEEGYELRPAGGGLTLHKRPCGTRLCKASELGFAYRALVKRFRAGMPGHPHGSLDLVFERPVRRQVDLPLEGDDIFEVIDFER
jgi:hypothetical protein